MLDAIKKLKAHKRKVLRKHANVEEVANIFEGQRFSDEDVKMGPRNKGWKVIAKETKKTKGGMIIEKTTRIRSFGRLKKTAFLRGFQDELEQHQTKKASYLQKFAAGLRAKMVVEPSLRKSPVLKKNPFLRLQAKRRLVSGRERLNVAETPKAKGLMSGKAQFAHLVRKQKEAS